MRALYLKVASLGDEVIEGARQFAALSPDEQQHVQQAARDMFPGLMGRVGALVFRHPRTGMFAVGALRPVGASFDPHVPLYSRLGGLTSLTALGYGAYRGAKALNDHFTRSANEP